MRLIARKPRMARTKATIDTVLVRNRDGRPFMAHHQGAASLGALLRGRASFYFVPLRRWRGRWVAAADYGWSPQAGAEFTVRRLGARLPVVVVGKCAAMGINEGGFR